MPIFSDSYGDVPHLSDIGYEVELEATHVASMGIDGGGSMKKGN
jgi:hypothetical protein